MHEENQKKEFHGICYGIYELNGDLESKKTGRQWLVIYNIYIVVSSEFNEIVI